MGPATTTLDEMLIRIMRDVGPVDVLDLVKTVNQCQKSLYLRSVWRWAQKIARITTTAVYNTGTVRLTEESATVTGSGTTFTSGMVGRKFQRSQSTGRFVVSAYVSPTEITLDRQWPFDTETGVAYSIFEDTYSLPSDLGRLKSVYDVRTGYALEAVEFDDALSQYGGVYVLNPASVYGLKYAQWGKDDTTKYPQIRLFMVPNESRELDVYYHSEGVAVSNVASIPDVANYMEEVLYQLVLGKYIARMPKDSAQDLMRYDRLRAENQQNYATAFTEARRADSRVSLARMRNERVIM